MAALAGTEAELVDQDMPPDVFCEEINVVFDGGVGRSVAPTAALDRQSAHADSAVANAATADAGHDEIINWLSAVDIARQKQARKEAATTPSLDIAASEDAGGAGDAPPAAAAPANDTGNAAGAVVLRLGAKPAYICRLHLDEVAHILSFVSVVEIGRVMTTCKLLRTFGKDELVWHSLAKAALRQHTKASLSTVWHCITLQALQCVEWDESLCVACCGCARQFKRSLRKAKTWYDRYKLIPQVPCSCVVNAWPCTLREVCAHACKRWLPCRRIATACMHCAHTTCDRARRTCSKEPRRCWRWCTTVSFDSFQVRTTTPGPRCSASVAVLSNTTFLSDGAVAYTSQPGSLNKVVRQFRMCCAAQG